MQKCRSCKKRKPLSDFKLRRGKPESLCRDCHNADMRKRYADPEYKRKMRDRVFRKKYGISADEYDAMLVRQHGRCAICGTHKPGGPHDCFVVDHDHETGAVRGLLCMDCNLGIGCLKDNIRIVVAAAQYLAMPTLARYASRLDRVVAELPALPYMDAESEEVYANAG